jgi:HlyD family secretion protein
MLRGAPASPNDLAIARLKVQAAEARLSAARLQAGRLTVHAPSDGTVTALLAVPGSPADPSTPIATVADLRHLAVSVDLSEFDIARVRRGDAAVLSVDALGGKQLHGRVVFVALTGTDSGGVVTFPVRVELTHTASVKPGMNVSVKIIVAQRSNVVRVPLEAVTDQGIAGHRVTVVATGGRTSSRPVTLGLADNKQVEIRSGLRPGERVLLATPGG